MRGSDRNQDDSRLTVTATLPSIPLAKSEILRIDVILLELYSNAQIYRNFHKILPKIDLSESQQQNTLRRVALIIRIAFQEKKDTDTASAAATIKDREISIYALSLTGDQEQQTLVLLSGPVCLRKRKRRADDEYVWIWAVDEPLNYPQNPSAVSSIHLSILHRVLASFPFAWVCLDSPTPFVCFCTSQYMHNTRTRRWIMYIAVLSCRGIPEHLRSLPEACS
ncbi:hypothetical protein KQX54_020808 [Cotesia glomerata]|uniref:Uncharacterized protein n=1 Tax=Cotesia glomerata TaxID=32391 RepID=A0AAV7I1X1_COTGL|nr:hypothetical protein KQX54_020808 [Cotesia glomerata]